MNKPDVELLGSAAEFWQRAEADIRNARQRVYVQAMTFEGDHTGQMVANAVAESPAADRRILVDRFTRWIVSDRFIWSPANLFDRALRQEVRDTRVMFERVVASGGTVQWTDPVGLFLWQLPLRNHKKLVLADDAVYVGGINFSDHNFAWDDFMVRLEAPEIAGYFAEDFLATCAGTTGKRFASIGNLEIHNLDGRDNPNQMAAVLNRFRSADRSIQVVSPYLTAPFTRALGEARKRGVDVTVYTSADNNKPLLQRHILREARNFDLTVRLVPGMLHMKGAIVDGAEVVFGSSNFDFVSYSVQKEFVLILRSKHFARTVDHEIFAPLQRRSSEASGFPRRPLGGALDAMLLNIATAYLRAARRLSR